MVRELFLLIDWGTASYPVIRYCARKEEDQQRKKGKGRGLSKSRKQLDFVGEDVELWAIKYFNNRVVTILTTSQWYLQTK